MLHNITELRYITKSNGHHAYYFADYAPKQATQARYHTAKTINITQRDGSIKRAYMYGNYIFSYDEAEIIAHRETQKKAYDEMVYRNKLMRAITDRLKDLTTEELESIVAEI